MLFYELVDNLKNFEIIQRLASQVNTPKFFNSCPVIDKELLFGIGSFKYYHFRDEFHFAEINHGYSIVICLPFKVLVQSCHAMPLVQ